MQPLLVTAAVVFHQDKLLITQRPAGKDHGGLWEFPGGKLEENEAPVEALHRELDEELGLTVDQCQVYDVVYHRYDERPVLLLVYRCSAASPTVHHHEVADHAWISPDQLRDYPILPADKTLVDKLIAEHHCADG